MSLGWLLHHAEVVAFLLFAFLIGVEIGQILIVALVLGFGYLLLNVFKLSKMIWTISISLIEIVVAIDYLFRDNLDLNNIVNFSKSENQFFFFFIDYQ